MAGETVMIGIEREGETLLVALRGSDGRSATLTAHVRGGVALAAALDRVARDELDAELTLRAELEVST